MANPDSARELIFNMFFNFERYDLSKVGRYKLWSRLPELKPEKKGTYPKKTGFYQSGILLK